MDLTITNFIYPFDRKDEEVRRTGTRTMYGTIYLQSLG